VVKVGGRAPIDWLPIWIGFGWAQATRNNEFYTSPDLALDLPDGVLDLPGELFGIELHHYSGAAGATVANPTPAAYGIVRDTFRHRLVAVAEVAGTDFLFCDPADQQARIGAWGAVLDHVAQSLPWGFATSARQRRTWQDAAQREEDLVEGRTVHRVVWLLTVTAATPAELDTAVGQVAAAARRGALELRRMAGTQRQAFGATLPLCRGAR
jgi:hypothetical protein